MGWPFLSEVSQKLKGWFFNAGFVCDLFRGLTNAINLDIIMCCTLKCHQNIHKNRINAKKRRAQDEKRIPDKNSGRT